MIDFFLTIGHAIMTPLYYVTSGVLIVFHDLFREVLSLPEALSWALSIVGLTLVIRICLIPLFVKQIKNSRNMQLLQPKVKELQKKYGHDRERLTQETMKLYKETGTNPLASCFPLLLQMPIFLALFRTLNEAAHDKPVGFLTNEQVDSLRDSVLFGIAKISESFTSSATLAPKILTGCLVVLMTLTTFTTQRQLMRKNMPESALTGQYAQQQKLLLYVLPVVFAVGGIAFPIGVLLYWTTSNLWTMGQQFYVIRNNPTPGTPAFLAKEQRDKDKHDKHQGEPPPATGAASPVRPPVTPPPDRIQPKKQSRQQRKKPRSPGQQSQPGKRPPKKPPSDPPEEGDDRPPKKPPAA
ncbi:MAG: membrane protein insertase YidC [Nocardioidaceae bacterium]